MGLRRKRGWKGRGARRTDTRSVLAGGAAPSLGAASSFMLMGRFECMVLSFRVVGAASTVAASLAMAVVNASAVAAVMAVSVRVRRVVVSVAVAMGVVMAFSVGIRGQWEVA